MKVLSRRARAAAAVLLLAGCMPALRGTPREKIGALRGRDAEVVLYSGERVLLHSLRVEGDSVYGGWTSTPAGDRQVVVALADIERVYDASPGLAERQQPAMAAGWGDILLAVALGAAVVMLMARGSLTP